jgi:thioesterase domain-containing protein/acyl carrier protein
MNSGIADIETPRAELVARLAKIWSHVLRVSPIEPDSNFFDLGGDSLMAVGLFLEIERETGVNLPITTIYDAPTIDELADVITDESAASECSPLVLLKPGDEDAPLFIVHGIGGTVMELSSLGRVIHIPSPVCALQARGLDGRQPPLDSIEDMAALYLDHVRKRQPRGPYHLAGYSFGGLIALEMARLLMRENQELAPPILIDAYAHPKTWPRASRLKMKARRSLHLARQHARAPLRESIPAALAQLGGLFRRKDARARLRDWLLDQNPDLPAPLLRVREAGSVALARYVPRYYSGKIIFLKASQPDPEFPDDPERIWNGLAKDMEISVVPGRHRTMVTDHAAALAKCLTAQVLAARGGQYAGSTLRPAAGNKSRLEPQAV